MHKQLVDQIEERKFDIMEEFVNSESDQESFNDRLMTRQAILHEYLIQSGRSKEFLSFLRKNEAVELYETGKYQQTKRISKERLEMFGMTDMIPALTSKGYHVC